MQRYFSNIYWHFTGSPRDIDWHRVRKPDDISAQGAPKSSEDAFDIVKKILASRTLRAGCTEEIAPGLETDKFCCVTDIPFKDLPTHAPFYGKVAIGFRSVAIHPEFIPVLYLPAQRLPQEEVARSPLPALMSQASPLLASTGGWAQQQGARIMQEAHRLGTPITSVSPGQIAATKNFLKITEYSDKPGGSFYREREWRHVGEFSFKPEDVAALVVPEALLPKVQEFLTSEPQYSKTISLIAWEIIEQA
jgi:hypothetical protein